MSVDPELADTDQPYAYAGDDPVNSGDPSGDSPTSCSIAADVNLSDVTLADDVTVEGTNSKRSVEPESSPCFRTVSPSDFGWHLWDIFLESGDQDNFYVPGAQPIALVIHDLTGVTGEYVVTDPIARETRAFLARWSIIPWLDSTTSGCMFFLPSAGQPNYDLEINYHPLNATDDDDTPDGDYYVRVYTYGWLIKG